MKKRILGLAICTVRYGITRGYSKDRENAYKWAYSQGVTTMPTIEAANMNGNIKRAEMAKMVGQFIEHSDHIIAVQDLRQKCDFKDGKIGGDLQERIVTICQMGIMGQDGQGGTLTYFRPYDTVTRAEFGTLLSRVLRGDRYDGANPYYENHLTKLKLENIMVSIYNPQHIEKRGDIMEMLQKASALDISSNNNSKTTTITPKTEKEETENVFNILMGDNTSNTPSNTSTTEQKSDSTTKTKTETSKKDSRTEKQEDEDVTKRTPKITSNTKLFDSIDFEFTKDTLEYFSYTHLLSSAEFNDLNTILRTSAKYLEETNITTKMKKEILGDDYNEDNKNTKFIAYQYNNWIFGKEDSSQDYNTKFFLINTKLGITGYRHTRMGYVFTISHTINNEKIIIHIEDNYISQEEINFNHFNIPNSLTLFGEKYTLHQNGERMGGNSDFIFTTYSSKEKAEQNITQHIKNTQKFKRSYLISFEEYPGVFFEYDNTSLFDENTHNNYVGIYYSTEPIKTDKYKNVTDFDLTQKLTCYFGIQKTDANCSFKEVVPLYNNINSGAFKYGIVKTNNYQLGDTCRNDENKSSKLCKLSLKNNLPLYKLIPTIYDNYYILQPANGVIWEETTEGLGKPVVYIYDPEERENSLTVQLAEGANFTHLEPYFSKGTTWHFTSDKNSNIKVKNQIYPYLYYSSTAPNYQNSLTGRFVAGKDINFFLNTKLDTMNFNKKEKSDFIEYRLPHFKDPSIYFIRFKFNEELDPYAKLIFKEEPDQVYRMFMEVLEVEPNTNITFSKNTPHEHDTEYLKIFDRKGGFEVLERGAWFTERR